MEKSTEERIKEAARTVFMRKGYDGARMQEIADEAGINKALLHYYFRSKNKLFGEIFHDAFNQLVPRIGEIIGSVLPVRQKLEYFIDNYIDFMMKHPYLPAFVIQEINRNPDYILEHFKGFSEFPKKVQLMLEEEARLGNIRPVNARQLITNIISLCLFPFIARPILSQIIFGGDQDTYDAFLEERKREVAEYVLRNL